MGRKTRITGSRFLSKSPFRYYKVQVSNFKTASLEKNLREAHRPPIIRRVGWFIGGLRFVKVLKEEGVRGRRGLFQESSFTPSRSPFQPLMNSSSFGYGVVNKDDLAAASVVGSGEEHTLGVDVADAVGFEVGKDDDLTSNEHQIGRAHV